MYGLREKSVFPKPGLFYSKSLTLHECDHESMPYKIQRFKRIRISHASLVPGEANVGGGGV
jgi:hypothetical protein